MSTKLRYKQQKKNILIPFQIALNSLREKKNNAHTGVLGFFNPTPWNSGGKNSQTNNILKGFDDLIAHSIYRRHLHSTIP